jgi:hypothetical protein
MLSMKNMWLIYMNTERLAIPSAKKFTGTTSEIDTDINEFLNERPHIKAIDIAESVYNEYCEED